MVFLLRLVLDRPPSRQHLASVCGFQQLRLIFPPPSASLSDEEEARFNPTLSMDLALSFYYALRRREMTDIWQPTPGISTRGSHWLVSSVEG